MVRRLAPPAGRGTRRYRSRRMRRIVASSFGLGLIPRRLRGSDSGAGHLRSGPRRRHRGRPAGARRPVVGWALVVAVRGHRASHLWSSAPFAADHADPGWVCIDETAGTLVALIGLAGLAVAGGPGGRPRSPTSSRCCPAYAAAERLPGAVGITADDVVAGLYGLAVGWALTALPDHEGPSGDPAPPHRRAVRRRRRRPHRLHRSHHRDHPRRQGHARLGDLRRTPRGRGGPRHRPRWLSAVDGDGHAGTTRGMVVGYGVLVARSVGAATATALGSFPMLVAPSRCSGLGRAPTTWPAMPPPTCIPPHRRGAAIAFVVWAGTIGSVFGPSLLAPAEDIGRALDIEPLAGGYLLAASGLAALALAVIAALLRPDPLEFADRGDRASSPRAACRSRRRYAPRSIGLAVGQVVMVLIMVMTPDPRPPPRPLAGRGRGDHLGSHPGDVCGLSGHRNGRRPRRPPPGDPRRTGRAGGPAVLAAIADDASTGILTVALFLLGLGWNFSFVAGSALLTEGAAAESGSVSRGSATPWCGPPARSPAWVPDCCSPRAPMRCCAWSAVPHHPPGGGRHPAPHLGSARGVDHSAEASHLDLSRRDALPSGDSSHATNAPAAGEASLTRITWYGLLSSGSGVRSATTSPPMRC